MKFHNIVVAVDLSRTSIAAIRRARGALATGGEIHLVHVLTPGRGGSGATEKKLSRDQLLKVARTELPRHGLLVRLHILSGEPAPQLLAACRRYEADLVVVGSHARGPVGRLFLGSVAEDLARRAEVPVLIVRELQEGEGTIERVIVAVDDGEPARVAARAAVELARTLGARVEAVRVLDPALVQDLRERGHHAFPDHDVPPRAAEDLRAVVSKRLRGILGPDARIHYAAGDPAEVIASHAGPRDVVACGTHGRGALGRLAFGSVATKLIRTAPCPILVVRPSRRLEPAGAGSAAS